MKNRTPISRAFRTVAAAAVIAAFSAVGFGSNAIAADKTLAWIPKSTDSSFWLAIKRGAEKAGEELGYEVLYVGTQDQTQIAGQINLVNDMVTRKIDGILIAATDAKALSAPVANAVEAGVPVITVDSGIDPDTSLAYIATDNVGAARAAAKTLAALIGGKGKVGDIGITAGSQTGYERESGFLEEMKNYPDIEVVPVQYSGCSPAKALNIATDTYTGNPDLVGFYGACDGAGTGAGQLTKQKDLDLRIVAFDSSAEEFELFKEGFIDALILQDPYKMGYDGVYAMDKLLKGEKVEPRTVAIPAQVVTLENMNEPAIQKLLSDMELL
jgi:ribose transport system substrate-binding protein